MNSFRRMLAYYCDKPCLNLVRIKTYIYFIPQCPVTDDTTPGGLWAPDFTLPLQVDDHYIIRGEQQTTIDRSVEYLTSPNLIEHAIYVHLLQVCIKGLTLIFDFLLPRVEFVLLHSVILTCGSNQAKFPHSPILHYACGSMYVVLCFATKKQQKPRIVSKRVVLFFTLYYLTYMHNKVWGCAEI